MTHDLRRLDQHGTRVVYLLGNAVRRLAKGAESPLQGLRQATRALLSAAGPCDLRFERGAAWLNDHLLRTGGGMGIQLTALYRLFHSRGLSGVKLRPGLGPDAWPLILKHVLAAPEVARGGSATNELLSASAIPGVRLLPLGRGPDARRRELRAGADVDLYGRALARVGTLFAEDRAGTQAFARVAQELVASVVRDPRHLLALIGVPFDVAYEVRHPVNTAVLALAVGRHLGLARGALMDLCLCALAADAGMADVPRDVLAKAEALTPEELEQVRHHPLDSVRRVLEDPRLDVAARRRLVVAFEHHIEGADGGYPKVHGWSRQHLYSRVVSVCDAFDAMVADKPWRQGMLPDEALAQLLVEAGGRLDPTLVVALAETLGRFPVGSAVLLDTGELAVVHAAAPDDDPSHPWVRLVADASAAPVSPGAPLNLAVDGRAVVRSVQPEPLGIDAGAAVFGGLGASAR